MIKLSLNVQTAQNHLKSDYKGYKNVHHLPIDNILRYVNVRGIAFKISLHLQGKQLTNIVHGGATWNF